MASRYEIRLSRRNRERERMLCGESLDAFHKRENARPPSLSEIYAHNQVNRERCPWTWDIEDLLQED